MSKHAYKYWRQCWSATEALALWAKILNLIKQCLVLWRRFNRVNLDIVRTSTNWTTRDVHRITTVQAWYGSCQRRQATSKRITEKHDYNMERVDESGAECVRKIKHYLLKASYFTRESLYFLFPTFIRLLC